MDIDKYQEWTGRTAPTGDNLVNYTLGLTGEAGEVADYVKKCLYQGHTMDKNKLIAELGDVLWYVARLANELDSKLSLVATQNLRKLYKRYPQGFNPDQSVGRTE